MGENIALWALNLVYIINKHFLTNLVAFFYVFNFFDQKLFLEKNRFRPQNYNILNVSLQVPFVTYVVLDDTF